MELVDVLAAVSMTSAFAVFLIVGVRSIRSGVASNKGLRMTGRAAKAWGWLLVACAMVLLTIVATKLIT